MNSCKIFKKNSETSFENIIVIIFIFVLAIVSIHQYLKIIKYAKAAQYTEEVEEINDALISYRIVYGKFPANLKILIKSKYRAQKVIGGKLKYIKERFISHIKTDKNGYPISPFGKKFIYDRKTGMVLLNGGGAGT